MDLTSQLSNEEKVGALFFIGIPGPELDAETVALLSNVKPGGVCLFARNIRGLSQTRELTDGLREICGPSALISIDQEGGRVDRLRRILEPMPAASQMRGPEDAERLAELTARALAQLGINMNFAPVVDVGGAGRDSSVNGLATRLFGQSAEDVVEYTRPYMHALHDLGIRTCVKHFPGLAKSRVDSHEELPAVDCSEEELGSVDLVPYKELALDPETTAVMVGHAAYVAHPLQAKTPSGEYIPSSIGGGFISQLLRRSVGFDGVVITDDLEMGAILRNHGIEEASIMAIAAGNDQLLICNDAANIEKAYAAVLGAVEDGRITADRVDESLARLERFKSHLLVPRALAETEFAGLDAQIKQFKATLS